MLKFRGVSTNTARMPTARNACSIDTTHANGTRCPPAPSASVAFKRRNRSIALPSSASHRRFRFSSNLGDAGSEQVDGMNADERGRARRPESRNPPRNRQHVPRGGGIERCWKHGAAQSLGQAAPQRLIGGIDEVGMEDQVADQNDRRSVVWRAPEDALPRVLKRAPGRGVLEQRRGQQVNGHQERHQAERRNGKAPDVGCSHPTPRRQFRPFIVSSDPSSSAPTLLRQSRLFCVSTRLFIVSSDSSSSVPTLHRQHRLFCVSSRLFIVRTDYQSPCIVPSSSAMNWSFTRAAVSITSA